MTYVDERIVELRFDNKQFEQETAKTMSTLDKLKEKLSFKNASTGAEHLQKAVANINVNPIIQGIDTIETKMSALAIAGKRVVENIVDWAMSGISKISNKIQAPINQIIQGGKTRAQNIEQAKFMLKGLKVEWDDIKDDINYGVQDTAYGLDAAAKVASQLVASNVSLGKDMKTSLRAVSGVAAMTNSTYEDIGHVFTTVAGQGRVMGDQLLQLSTRGLNVAADLAKVMNTTESEIRDMVSKGKIDFQTFANAMDELYGEHAKKANETFTGALSNTKAALSRLGADIAAQGFTSLRDILIEIIPKLKEFKTKMKPAEDAINKMIEAVGKLVQTLIKSIDIEAIVNKISPIIQTAANGIHDFAEEYERLFKKDHTQEAEEEAEKLEEYTEQVDDVTAAMKRLYEISEDEKQMAWDIWNWGTYGNGQDRIDALQEHYNMVQAYVNKMIELGWDEAKMNEFLAEQLKAHEEEVAQAETAEKERNRAQNIAKIVYNLRRVLVNVGKSIANVVSVAFKAFGKVVGSKGASGVLASFTDILADASDKFVISKKKAEKLLPIFEVIGKILEYAWKALKLFVDGVKKGIDSLSKLISKAKESEKLQKLFDKIKTGITNVGTALKNTYERIKNSEGWNKFLDILKVIGSYLIDGLAKAFEVIGDVASKIADGTIDIFGKLGEKIAEIRDNAKDGHPWLDKIKDFFKEDVLSGSWLTKLKDLLDDIFGKGKDVFKTAFDKASDFINGLIQGFKNIKAEDLYHVLTAVGVLSTIFTTVRTLWTLGNVNSSLAKSIDGIDAVLEALNVTVNKWGKRADAERFQMFAISIGIIVGSVVALMTALMAAQYLGFNADKLFLLSAGFVTLVTIIAGVVVALTALWSKAKYTNSQGNVNILPRLNIPGLAATIFAFGYMMQSLIRSISTMYHLINDEEFSLGSFAAAVGVISGVIVVTGILVGVLSHFAKNSENIWSIALVVVSMSILISSIVKSFVKLVRAIDNASIGSVIVGALAIEVFMATIMGFVLAIQLIMAKFGNSNPIQTNPFKGIPSTLLALAALIRFGVIPLIQTLTGALKLGVIGLEAIKFFMLIMVGLLGFITALTVVTQGINAITKGSSTFSFIGLAATVAAMALMFSSIAKTLNNLKGIDSGKIAIFFGLLTAITLVVSALGALAVIASVLAGPLVAAALISLGVLIASVGASFMMAGYGFKAFEEGLVHLVQNLPNVIDSLMSFFDKVEKHGADIKAGIVNTVSLVVESIMWGTVAGSLAMRETIPVLVKAWVACTVDAINGLADAIFDQGDDFVDAVWRLGEAFAYVIGYAALKGSQKGSELFANSAEKSIAGIIFQRMGKKVGKADWYEESEKELEDMRLTWGEQGKKTGEESATAWIGGLKDSLKKVGDSDASKVLDWNTFLNFDDLENTDNDINNKINSFVNGIDISQYKDKINEFIESGGQISDWFTGNWTAAEIVSAIDTGDFSTLTNKMGFDWGEGSLEGYQKAIEEGGPEAAEEYLKMFTNIDTLTGDQAEVMAGLGTENMDQYINSINEKKDPTVQAFKSILDECVGTIASYEVEFYTMGLRLHEGFNMGIADKDPSEMTIKSVTDMVRQAEFALAREAQIESPSKVFMRFGEYVTLGFADGILNMAKAAETSTEEVGENSMLALKSILDRIYSTTIDGMDANPVITPVLDLSELQTGLSSMDGMLNNNSSFGLAFDAANSYNNNLGARNLALEQMQNPYDDTNTINAINSLNGEVSTLKNAIEGMQVVIDGRALVGQIATPMDKALGRRTITGRRGI